MSKFRDPPLAYDVLLSALSDISLSLNTLNLRVHAAVRTHVGDCALQLYTVRQIHTKICLP